MGAAGAACLGSGLTGSLPCKDRNQSNLSVALLPAMHVIIQEVDCKMYLSWDLILTKHMLSKGLKCETPSLNFVISVRRERHSDVKQHSCAEHL